MTEDEFTKAQTASREELLDHWVVIWDSNALGDDRTTEASLCNNCQVSTDDQGNLWLMRGDKPIGVYNATQWRKAARLVLRSYDGEVVQMPVDEGEGPEGASA